jgi:hypothetical protein
MGSGTERSKNHSPCVISDKVAILGTYPKSEK